MKISIVGLVALAALFCTLQLATAASFSLADAKKFFFPPQLSKLCPPSPGSGSGNEDNASTGSGNGAGAGAGNDTTGSAGATRALPILGLPIGNILP
nr:cell wall protein qid3-like [Drosophila kikkawai]